MKFLDKLALKIFSIIPNVLSPLNLIIPIPPIPGAVDIDTIVLIFPPSKIKSQSSFNHLLIKI